MHHQPTSTRSRLPFAPASLILVAACSGGGSGAPPASGPTSGGASYEASDFDYEDPNPAAFHPLGLSSSVLTRRDELMILNVPEDPGTARATIFDDIGAGAGVLGELDAIAGPGLYRSGAAGNTDDDGEDELLMVRLVGSAIEVLQVERGVAGDYSVTDSFTIPKALFTYDEVRLSLGDVDGDHRDELLIFATSAPIGQSVPAAAFWLRVYDDSTGGWALLHEETWNFLYPSQSIRDVQLEAADVDGDGEDEVALLLLSGFSSASEAHLRLLDGASGGFAQLQGFTEVDKLLGDDAAVSLRAAQLDADASDELVVVTYHGEQGFGTGFGEAVVQSFEYDGSTLVGSPERKLSCSPGSTFPFLLATHRAFAAVPLDRDADGIDELAVLLPGAGPSPGQDGRVEVLAFDGVGWVDDVELDLPELEGDDAASLVATDDDADGQGELYYCRISGSSSSGSKSRLVKRIDWGAAGAPVTDTWTATVTASDAPYPPVLVAGDFDADGLTVRYTGNKLTKLSDPKPLIVLSAPPTKAGLSQNYGATQSSYAVSTGVTESYGVASSVTVSVYSGFAVSDLFDVFGASARETVSESLLTSETQGQSVTTVQGFSGADDADTIVFEGSLYQSYEYEILASPDPALVGTYFTIDVPVQSKVYKWTVDYYNSQVDPALAIGPDVLGHTIGDPTSYSSQSAALLLVDQFVGWKTPSAPILSVGQGQGSNKLEIQLEQFSTTDEQRTFSVDWEAGFTVGGAEFGGSFGLTDTFAYAVTVSQETVYTGVVGDISSPEEWEDWGYEFGLAVYHRGLTCDSSNEPVAQQPGVLPYQVLTYWTHPTGSGY